MLPKSSLLSRGADSDVRNGHHSLAENHYTEIGDDLRSIGIVQVAILNVISSAPDRSYGIGIAAELTQRIGRTIPDAQVFTALRRLESQGMIEGSDSPVAMPSQRTRGRPRKYYSLTVLGRRALHNAVRHTHGYKPLQQSDLGVGNEGKTEEEEVMAAAPLLGST